MARFFNKHSLVGLLVAAGLGGTWIVSFAQAQAPRRAAATTPGTSVSAVIPGIIGITPVPPAPAPSKDRAAKLIGFVGPLHPPGAFRSNIINVNKASSSS